jgi:hypothetical protein
VKAITVLALLFVCQQAFGQFVPGQPKRYGFSRQQLIDFDQQVYNSISPKLPENSYFPPFVKERIGWVESQLAAGKLGRYTVAQSNYGLRMASAALEVKPGLKIPVIYIFLTELAKFAIVQTGSLSINELLKNTYAVGYTHESIHLERSVAQLEQASRTDLKEEARAWLKTAKLAIHPFVVSHHPLEDDMVRLDSITGKCNYVEPCPALTDWLSRYH